MTPFLRTRPDALSAQIRIYLRKAITSARFCLQVTNNRSRLALFETIDEQANHAVEGFIYVQRDAKATGNLQCDEAMHHAAQHANGVNALVSLQVVGREDAQHDFNNLLL